MRRLPLALLALLLVPAAARADTYCVGKPDCSGTTVPSLEEARVSVNAHPGPDRVEIGAGTFDGPLAAFLGGADIVGAGPGATIVNASKATQAMNSSAPGGTVSGMTIRLNANNAVGVDVTAGTVTDVTVETTLADNPSQNGVILRGGGTVRRVGVPFPTTTSPTNYGIAVYGEKDIEPVPTTIEDVTLSAGYGIFVSQIKPPVAINRALIHGGVYGISTRGDAHVTATDLFARVDGPLSTASGVYVADDYSTEPITMELRHATLLSESPSGAGVGARSNVGQAIHISLRDTFLQARADRYSRDIRLYGATVTAGADHSAFDPGRVQPLGSVVGPANQDTAAAPANLTAAGAPGPGSSLIDHASDLGGFDGDSDGVAVRDIGAVEAPAGTTPKAVPKSVIVKASKRRISGRSTAPTRLSVTRRRHGVCQALRADGKLKKVKKAGKGCAPLFALSAPAGAWTVRLPRVLGRGRWTITSRAKKEAHGDVQVLKVN